VTVWPARIACEWTFRSQTEAADHVVAAALGRGEQRGNFERWDKGKAENAFALKGFLHPISIARQVLERIPGRVCQAKSLFNSSLRASFPARLAAAIVSK
jgi:hypothetical protein